MLQLIIGTAGTGKSVFIKEKILECIMPGIMAILFHKCQGSCFLDIPKKEIGF